MESEWMAWAIVIATPFVLHALPRLRARNVALLMSFVFAVRLAYIGRSYGLFEKRYRTIESITDMLHRDGIPKALITFHHQQTESVPVFIMDWGTTYESLLLSALKNYEPQVTFRVADSTLQLEQPNAALMLGPFTKDEAGKLNPRYFHVDSTVPYRRLPLKYVLDRIGYEHSGF